MNLHNCCFLYLFIKSESRGSKLNFVIFSLFHCFCCDFRGSFSHNYFDRKNTSVFFKQSWNPNLRALAAEAHKNHWEKGVGLGTFWLVYPWPRGEKMA